MMETMKFDLMQPRKNGQKLFLATMRYPQNPLFKFNVKEFYEWLLQRRPSLRGKKIACEFGDKTGAIIYFNMTDSEIMNYE